MSWIAYRRADGTMWKCAFNYIIFEKNKVELRKSPYTRSTIFKYLHIIHTENFDSD